jgi:signal transduction histidine kinase
LFSPGPPAADNYYLQDKDNKSMTTILSDRPKISEVLFNLIDNVLKFTEHGSVSIYLKAHHSFYSPHHYHNNHSSSYYQTNDSLRGTVTVSVTDTGKGIDASIKKSYLKNLLLPLIQEELV